MMHFKLNIKTFIILFFCFVLSSCTTTTIQTHHPIKKITANLSVADRTYAQLQQAIPIYQEAVLHPWANISPDVKLKQGISLPDYLK